MAAPSCSPGYHASRIDETRSTQGIRTGPLVSSTTTVRGLTDATAWISAFWSPGRLNEGRSNVSPL